MQVGSELSQGLGIDWALNNFARTYGAAFEHSEGRTNREMVERHPWI